MEFNRSLGHAVAYGTIIQLRHLRSGKFVGQSRKRAKVDAQSMALSLVGGGNKGSWLRIQSADRNRADGEHVHIGDQVNFGAIKFPGTFVTVYEPDDPLPPLPRASIVSESDNEGMAALLKPSAIAAYSSTSRQIPFSTPMMRARGPSDIGVLGATQEPLGDAQDSPRPGVGKGGGWGVFNGSPPPQTDPRKAQRRGSWNKKSREWDTGKKVGRVVAEGGGDSVTTRQRLEVNASSHSYDLQIQLIRSWKTYVNWRDADRDDEREQQLSVHGELVVE
jgi:hypothetical protein